jgi:hypothetical protein
MSETSEAKVPVTAQLIQPTKEERNAAVVPIKKKPTLEAKVHRLAQNRKAARESRKRKKAMIEDLQKSLVFFSKNNAGLRNENHELTRLLLNAQAALRREGLTTTTTTNMATHATSAEAAAAATVAALSTATA